MTRSQTLGLLVNLKGGPSQTMCLPAMTLHSHTVNLGGNAADLLLMGSFPSHLASRHLPMLFETLGFLFVKWHPLFSLSPYPGLPSHWVQTQNQDLCTWYCLVGKQCPHVVGLVWVHNSVPFLKFREAGLSNMPISYFGPTFTLVSLTFDRVTLYSFRVLSEMLPFCLFLLLG